MHILQPVRHYNFEFFDIKRFDDIIQCPQFKSLNRLLDRSKGRHQNHRNFRFFLFDKLQNVQSTFLGKFDVRYNKSEVFLLYQFKGLDGRQCRFDRIPFLCEDHREKIQNAFFIVNDKNFFHFNNLP